MTEDEIFVVSHGFNASYERGFCNGLAANGLRPTLVGSDRSDYAGLCTAVRSVNLRGSQDEKRGVIRKLFNLVRYHFQLIAYVAGRRDATVHVIGLTYPPLWCGVVEAIWFRLNCRRYLLTAHNILPHDRHTRWMRIVHWMTYRLPQCCVVHTREMADELASSYGIARERIVVMEHGLEPVAAAPAATTRGDVSAPMRLLFFGAVAPYKGLDLLLDALKQTDFPWRLQIAGTSVNSAYLAEIRRRIDEHPAETSIRWRDEFIPEQEVAGLFAAADALVLPYRHIDQSGVLFEALRFGVPVVASRVGAFTRYVTPEIGETCPPNDALALASALGRLRSRLPELSRQRIIELGRNYAWPLTVRPVVFAYS
jgi:glycosyltransferase involved in cell wall biosynthesis